MFHLKYRRFITSINKLAMVYFQQFITSFLIIIIMFTMVVHRYNIIILIFIEKPVKMN